MLLPQLPQFWLDRHHCDTYIDIVIPCHEHASIGASKPSITGYCLCEKACNGLCGLVSASAALNGEEQHVVASLPCHRVLLSAASAYFSALLGPTWNDGLPSSMKHIPLMLPDVEDVPAMIALLKCIYTSDVDLNTSDLAAIADITNAGSSAGIGSSSSSSSCSSNENPCSSLLMATAPGGLSIQRQFAPAAACKCACNLALQELQASFTDTCWQELSVRVLRLADQFSVPGALKAAVGKLSCLFSYQLSWPAVLAVLWLPAAVAQQPMLKELRQMAINRVTQDMKHLDPCLASPLGRSILQRLPPDALATLLASDQLALYSENSTLTAIDVWLAGPVASSLAAAPDDVTFEHSIMPLAAGTLNDTAGDAAAVGSQSLAAALHLLVRQVRLPLCSGAFLAAAVSQRPWLCLGLQGSHELGLMQQYYSSDSHGRYELAMRLLRSGQSCPWSVVLRRGLPGTFNASSSSIHTAESSNTSPDKHLGGNANGGTGIGRAAGFGTYTGLSQIRGLLDCGLQEARRDKITSSSTAGFKGLVQQQQQQPPCAEALAAAGGIVLEERVLGGHFWQLSLVAIPVAGSSSSDAAICGSCSGVTAAATAMESAAADVGCGLASIAAQGRGKLLLCLSVTCRPAWANVLDRNNPEYEAAAVRHSVRKSAAVDSVGLAQDHHQQQQQRNKESERCATCDALWSIAGAKAAEAVARHTPTTQQLLNPLAAAAAACCCVPGSVGDPMKICSNTATAAAAAGVGVIPDVTDSCSQVQVPGFCGRQESFSGSSSSSTADFVHLDVVVGIQLLAAPSREQLQQHAGEGTAKNGSQSHALTHLPCLLLWDASAGAARGLLPVDVTAVGSGSNMLRKAGRAVGDDEHLLATAAAAPGQQGQREGAAAAAPDAASGVSALPGWQPEVWSGFAPGGALYWHCSLKPLMD